MKNNLVVTLANKQYVDQAKQLFSSVYFNAAWDGDYMLLAYRIPKQELAWFSKRGILVKECKNVFAPGKLKELYKQKEMVAKEKFEEMHSLEYVGAVINKLHLFTKEFKKWGRVIFIDADMTACASLQKLTQVNGLWAVRDMAGPKLKQHFSHGGNALLQKLKRAFNLNKPAFNDGFFVFSTDIIEKETSFELKELFRKYYPITRCVEQSILNLFFYRRWQKLPPIYNVVTKIFSENSGTIIVHYAGSNKPQKAGSLFYPVWKELLEKSEGIQDVRIPHGKPKEFSAYQLWTASSYMNSVLEIRYTIIKIKKIRLKIESAIDMALNTLDATVGKSGIILKKKLPKIYHLIKNIQNEA